MIFQLTMVIEANGMQFGLSHMRDFKIELVRSGKQTLFYLQETLAKVISRSTFFE